MGALSGIRVLDFSHYIAGPHCSQILADHGADVIKIEPLHGEPSRKANPMYEDLSTYYASMNRNKRSFALDLKAPSSKEIIRKLVLTADVIVTNYSVGVPERLGFGYEEIAAINPKIIMAHISGFGLTGPMKNDGAFDGIIQALSGVAHLTGEQDGPPLKTGLFIADHIAAFQGAIGILLALSAREKTGLGQLVDISMFDSMVSMLAYNFSLVSTFDKSPTRAGNRSTNVFATTFKSKDGYLYIAPLTEKMWEDFCEIIGRPEFNERYSTTNIRLKNYAYLEAEVTKWTEERTSEEIMHLLLEKRIACGKVNSIEDLLSNEQLKERKMLLTLQMKDTEILVPGPVIKLSEHSTNEEPFVSAVGEQTTDILLEIGYSESEIEELVQQEYVATK